MTKDKEEHVSSLDPYVRRLAKELINSINLHTTNKLFQSYICSNLARALLEETQFFLIDREIDLTNERRKISDASI